MIAYIETGEIWIYEDIDEAFADWKDYPNDILSDVRLYAASNLDQ